MKTTTPTTPGRRIGGEAIEAIRGLWTDSISLKPEATIDQRILLVSRSAFVLLDAQTVDEQLLTAAAVGQVALQEVLA